jgi:hypothetical protein
MKKIKTPSKIHMLVQYVSRGNPLKTFPTTVTIRKTSNSHSSYRGSIPFLASILLLLNQTLTMDTGPANLVPKAASLAEWVNLR